MTKTIWKFELKPQDEQIVNMPSGARILTAQMQNAKLCLWALVEATNPKEERIIRIHGTGHIVPNDNELKYISSVQMENGTLVFHVFERLKV